jgi:hypothetical protein
MKKSILFLHLLLLLVILSDNTSNAQNGSIGSNDQISYAVIKNKPHGKEWKNEWNIFIANAIDNFGATLLDSSKLPKEQIKLLCPGFFSANNDQKKAFWALLFACIAYYESGFDPNQRFKEPASLNYVYSEGLLQLSYGDENNFKNLPIDPKKKNILDPEVNLTSGVIIMAKQLEKRKTLFTTKHFYWSVLTHHKQQIIRFFKNNSSQLTFCNLPNF